jgi:hypothetical protein
MLDGKALHLAFPGNQDIRPIAEIHTVFPVLFRRIHGEFPGAIEGYYCLTGSCDFDVQVFILEARPI